MATFTPQDVITEVRGAVQDNKVPYRYDDATILRAVNHILKRIALLRPDLFAYTTTFTCVQGVLQTLPADCVRLIDIIQVVSGGNVNEINRQTLDLALSTWQIGATGPCADWMRNVRNPNQFFVYPPSAPGQQLTVEYCQSPPTYAIGAAVALIADAYFPCVVDGTIWWLESADSESVSTGRAKMFQDSFKEMLGFSAQAKAVTDTVAGGEPPAQVI